MKLIRFDEDYFGYLIDERVTQQRAYEIGMAFKSAWPDKKLIVIQADEFIDLTGQYDIVLRETLEPESVA